jgi:hypothetical protein
MFDSSSPPVVCMNAHAHIYVICEFLRIVMSNTHRVVFLLCFSSYCVPYVATFSGLSTFNYPFGVL